MVTKKDYAGRDTLAEMIYIESSVMLFAKELQKNIDLGL